MIYALLLACHELPMNLEDTAGKEVDATSPEADPCTYAETAVASDDTTVGSSADTVVAFAGTRNETLTYADGVTTTDLTIETVLQGDPLLVTATPVDGATSCPDPALRVPLGVRFQTADGAFDLVAEEDVVITAEWAGDSLYVDAGVPLADNAGSFTRAGASQLSIPLNYLASTSVGEVITVDGGGDEEAPSECGIAAWGAPLQTGCGGS